MDGIHGIARRVKDTGDFTADDVMALCDFALSHAGDGDTGAAVNWTDVKSSNIRKFRYDPDNHELWITFNSGQTWIYADVPSDVVDEFDHADSKGGFFNANIKNQYQGRNEHSPAAS